MFFLAENIPIGTKLNSRNFQGSSENEIMEMSGSRYNSQRHTYYNEGQETYDDIISGQDAYYGNVNVTQEDNYNEVKEDSQYQALDLNRQSDYQELRQVQWSSNLNRQVNYQGLRQFQPHYEPANKQTEQIYENQSRY